MNLTPEDKHLLKEIVDTSVEENLMYKCIKGFSLEEYDDDGFTIENKYVDIEKGSNWFIPDDADYRFIGGEVRLENEEGVWIEITTDTLKEHFEKV